MMELLVATGNRGKVGELKDLLRELPLTIYGLADLGIHDRVPETGETFADNARLKSSAYAKLASMPALADDSGLAIDFLNGAPGVRSARWAGDDASDEDRINAVLTAMRTAAADERKARFVCAAAFADRSGAVLHCTEGICEGSIAEAPRGENGFGYDPIFVPDKFDLTFGELPIRMKRTVSHRAIAITKIIPFLQGFFSI
jgi:XTP/dITP diphosphohydrolase